MVVKRPLQAALVHESILVLTTNHLFITVWAPETSKYHGDPTIFESHKVAYGHSKYNPT